MPAFARAGGARAEPSVRFGSADDISCRPELHRLQAESFGRPELQAMIDIHV
jgi:hypothetical protein